MRIHRLINLSTLRHNPNAGRTVVPVCGRTYTAITESGIEQTREVSFYHLLEPEPAWLFSYEAFPVTCVKCGKVSLVEDLCDEYYTDENGDDYTVSDICPACGEPDCAGEHLLFEFETVEEAIARKERLSND